LHDLTEPAPLREPCASHHAGSTLLALASSSTMRLAQSAIWSSLMRLTLK
jgi:hypothetical protein